MLFDNMKIMHLDSQVGMLGSDGIYLDGHLVPPSVDKLELLLAKSLGGSKILGYPSPCIL